MEDLKDISFMCIAFGYLDSEAILCISQIFPLFHKHRLYYYSGHHSHGAPSGGIREGKVSGNCLHTSGLLIPPGLLSLSHLLTCLFIKNNKNTQTQQVQDHLITPSSVTPPQQKRKTQAKEPNKRCSGVCVCACTKKPLEENDCLTSNTRTIQVSSLRGDMKTVGTTLETKHMLKFLREDRKCF